MMNNETFISHIEICNYVALGLTFIFFNLIGNKKIMTIIFQRIFAVGSINYDYIVNNKKELKGYKLNIYNLFISLFYVLGLVLAIITSNLLASVIDNSLLTYLFSCLVFFVVSSFQIPFKYIAYTHIFEYQFEEDVMKLMKELGRKS